MTMALRLTSRPPKTPIIAHGKEYKVYAEKDANNIPWVNKNDGVEYVLEVHRLLHLRREVPCSHQRWRQEGPC